MQSRLSIIAVALAGLCLACKSKAQPPSPRPASQLSDAAVDDVATPPEARVAPPPDGRCPVVATAKRGGRFGVENIPKGADDHAGLTAVTLLAAADDSLHLALIGEIDTDNERGLSSDKPAPPRALRAYRYQDDTWEDLGSPLDISGWRFGLESGVGGGQPVIAIAAGAREARTDTVAYCDAGKWKQRPRFQDAGAEAVALLTSVDRVDNLSLKRGPITELGAECKPVSPFHTSPVPLSIQLPSGFAGNSADSPVELAVPGDCRLPRKFLTHTDADRVAVAYEQCVYEWGGDYMSISRCLVSVLWFADGEWQRLPSFEKLGAEEYETRHAIAIGNDGPTLAVMRARRMALYEYGADGWAELPALPGGSRCRLPVAVRGSPARVVVRSCGIYGVMTAFALQGARWKQVGSSLSLRPRWGAQGRPVVAADWLGNTPYVAIAYAGAPVARVFEGAGKKWQQILETVITLEEPASPSE